MAIRAGAKRYTVSALAMLALLLPGCAGLKRFAPPGIVRYENLSGDKPQNPQIRARVDARKAEREAVYPNLSEAPRAAPAAMAPEEQDGLKAALIAARDALAAGMEADRAGAEADRADGVTLPGARGSTLPLEAARDALAEKVETDDARARAERGLPPRPKLPPN